LSLETVSAEAIELFTEVLTTFPKFLQTDDLMALFQKLDSDWAAHQASELQAGEMSEDALQFGRFLLAFGDYAVQDLARNINDAGCQKLMLMLHNLMRSEGVAVAEDEIVTQALEFWTYYAEYLIDTLYEEGEANLPWFQPARAHLEQCIDEAWQKIWMPPPEDTVQWDSDTRKGFLDFRKDVSDLIMQSYPLLGVSLLQNYVDLSLQSLQLRDWRRLEAALFMVVTLSEVITESGSTEQEVLRILFSSHLFATLQDAEVRASVPTKTRQMAVSLIGNYTEFFERHKEFLPGALTFLFISCDDPSIAGYASRSIAQLCDSCRKALTPELPNFFNQYSQLSTTNDADTKKSLLRAIASVIQALPSEDLKLQPLQTLLGFLKDDFDRCLSHLDHGNSGVLEDILEDACTTLRCLASIGRGMRAPDDQSITIDSDDDEDTASPQSSNVWERQGKILQDEIVYMIETLQSRMPRNGEVLELVCTVYRIGFVEMKPGPFVFPPSTIGAFIVKQLIDTPRIDIVLTTAAALVTAYPGNSPKRIDGVVNNLIAYVQGFVHQLAGSCSLVIYIRAHIN
jgi:hypothetical protein